MTIGRPQGDVWIGRPLDLVIPLSVDDNESGGGLCIQADVLQGDTRVPSARVTVSLDPGNTPSTPRVRLRSTMAINEPVVSVNLSAGCQTKSTRNFVLLSDVLPQSATLAQTGAPERNASSSFGGSLPALSSRTGNASASRRATAVSADSAASDAPPPRRRASAPRSTQAVAVKPRPRPAPKVAPAAAPVAVAAAPAPAPAPARPVLQVDSLEPVAVKDGGLKASPEVVAAAGDDAAKRVDAIAQWRALASEPQAAPPADTQRLQALEATLAVLRSQSADTQRALTELRAELAQARDDRYRNPLIYGLIAALLLALLALLLLWRSVRRARAESAWWMAAQAERAAEAQSRLPRRGQMFDADDEAESAQGHGEKGEHDEDVAAQRRARLLAAQVAQDDAPDTSGFGMLEPRLISPATAASGPQRHVSADEMVDVQQHAEFFMSLGQHEQAINVLRHHIAANPDTSAMAYLDLFKILHDLDRRVPYAQLAQEFERAFNAQVPDFDDFAEEGHGLDHYKDVLARIEAVWPGPGTLALIEELVFRRPGGREKVFDLPAYRELLLLHSVARDQADNEGDWAPAPAPRSAIRDTAPAPLDTAPTELPATAVMPLDGSAGASEQDTAPASIFGSIDPRDDQHTAPLPMMELPRFEPPPVRPEDVEHVPMSEMPSIDMDLADFDRTAYETLRAPIDAPAPAPKSPPAPSTDPHVIDFDPFDPETEAQIAPKAPPPAIKR